MQPQRPRPIVAANYMQYRIVELNSVAAITRWVNTNKDCGAYLTGTNDPWVVLPGELLFSFLAEYGDLVSWV